MRYINAVAVRLGIYKIGYKEFIKKRVGCIKITRAVHLVVELPTEHRMKVADRENGIALTLYPWDRVFHHLEEHGLLQLFVVVDKLRLVIPLEDD